MQAMFFLFSKPRVRDLLLKKGGRQEGRRRSKVSSDFFLSFLTSLRASFGPKIPRDRTGSTHFTRSKTDTLFPTGLSTLFPSGVKSTFPCL